MKDGTLSTPRDLDDFKPRMAARISLLRELEQLSYNLNQTSILEQGQKEVHSDNLQMHLQYPDPSLKVSPSKLTEVKVFLVDPGLKNFENFSGSEQRSISGVEA